MCGESMQYYECHIWSTRRESVQYQEGRIISMRRRLCSVRRKCTVSEGYICSGKTGFVVWREDLQDHECYICPRQRESVWCQEKVVQCEEKVNSIKRVHPQ